MRGLTINCLSLDVFKQGVKSVVTSPAFLAGCNFRESSRTCGQVGLLSFWIVPHYQMGQQSFKAIAGVVVLGESISSCLGKKGGKIFGTSLVENRGTADSDSLTAAADEPASPTHSIVLRTATWSQANVRQRGKILFFKHHNKLR